MMSMMRKKREAERTKKLEDLFREADTNMTGKISKEQFVKLFSANDVVIPNIEEESEKITDAEGEIKFADFMKFATPTELCKIDHIRGSIFANKEEEVRIKKDSKKGKAESKMDKVELAFRKFDTNKDGFLSREEFDQMMKDVEKSQADRIFRSCDKEGNGKISLQEFRDLLQRGKEMQAKAASQDQPQDQQGTSGVVTKTKQRQ